MQCPAVDLGLDAEESAAEAARLSAVSLTLQFPKVPGRAL